LAELAIEFVLFHEIGRIVAGHHNAGPLRDDTTTLYEFSNDAKPPNGITFRHILECDADAFAFNAQSWLSSKSSKDIHEVIGENKWDVGDSGVIMYLIAVIATFRQLFPTAHSGLFNGNSTHPHPAVRSCLAGTAVIAKYCSDRNCPDPAMQFNRLLDLCLLPVEEAWERCFSMNAQMSRTQRYEQLDVYSKALITEYRAAKPKFEGRNSHSASASTLI